eukprot:TRINITY_DN4574_c0_g1_i1.p2 TRINITY_DN4574_c0_g1~~TRINITY_DN4574_c0_g1_i1.p2  ORF type:complete len:104 (-),score=50.81 TRINITY_DN4574_c0_g1_i1:182-493(-)
MATVEKRVGPIESEDDEIELELLKGEAGQYTLQLVDLSIGHLVNEPEFANKFSSMMKQKGVAGVDLAEVLLEYAETVGLEKGEEQRIVSQQVVKQLAERVVRL